MNIICTCTKYKTVEIFSVIFALPVASRSTIVKLLKIEWFRTIFFGYNRTSKNRLQTAISLTSIQLFDLHPSRSPTCKQPLFREKQGDSPLFRLKRGTVPKKKREREKKPVCPLTPISEEGQIKVVPLPLTSYPMQKMRIPHMSSMEVGEFTFYAPTFWNLALHWWRNLKKSNCYKHSLKLFRQKFFYLIIIKSVHPEKF